jgi:hypothetical protein
VATYEEARRILGGCAPPLRRFGACRSAGGSASGNFVLSHDRPSGRLTRGGAFADDVARSWRPSYR